MPPFIALTGGIGAGKSTALAAFERLGARTISSDEVVHALLMTPDLSAAVVGRFGAGVAPGGVVDRGALAALVFANDAQREWLEKLLWPRVKARVAAWRQERLSDGERARALVVEVPLLFEAGGEDLYDATVAVVADESVRARRAGARGHRAIAEREARQLSQADKAARATFVVVNDGTVEDLQRRLAELLAKLGA
ncbi:MAG: dephospho-CoA kinase [Solirubrobacteraceae bacterium]